MRDEPPTTRKLGDHPPALFRYGITPTSLPFTDDPAHPSVATLMITVLNPTPHDVACSRLDFSIPVGPGGGDLIPDGHAGEVDPRVLGAPWHISADGAGNFIATPDGSTTSIGAGDAIAFELSRVRINTVAGAVPIIVWEETDVLREGHVSPDLSKVPPLLSITKFTADAVQVLPGATVRLSWETYGAAEARLGWDGTSISVKPNGTHDVTPFADTDYHLTAYGGGTTAFAVIPVLVTKVRILSFDTDEPLVPQGGPATLRWEIANANKALLDLKPVNATRGTKIVTPSEPTVYALSASGPSGSATTHATVFVEPVRIVDFTAEPTSIRLGEQVTLRWSTAWSIGAAIAPGVGPVAGIGEMRVSPADDTTYVLTAQGYEGPIEAAAEKVTVAPVEAKLVVEPQSIAPGQTATLRWTTRSATSVSIAPGIGAVDNSGTHEVAPNEPTAYTLIAFGPHGPAIDRVSLHVNSVRITFTKVERRLFDNRAVVSWTTENCQRVDLMEPNGRWIRNLRRNDSHISLFAPLKTDRWLLRAFGAGKSPVEREIYLSEESTAERHDEGSVQ